MEIEKVSERQYLALGRADISRWVMDLAGRIPIEGGTFSYQDLSVAVLKMANRRVAKVRVVVMMVMVPGLE